MQRSYRLIECQIAKLILFRSYTYVYCVYYSPLPGCYNNIVVTIPQLLDNQDCMCYAILLARRLYNFLVRG